MASSTIAEVRPQASERATIGYQRALAPDLGRGLMLLLIVISNTMFYLYAAEHGATGWHPVSGNLLDRLAQFMMIVGLDLRVYPLFAFLFGYGMMQFYLRETGAGLAPKRASRLLRWRSLWLLVFGFLHAALLMAGDILGAYGLMAFVLGWIFLRRSNRTILIAAGIAIILLAALTILTGLTYLSGNVPTNLKPSVYHYASGEPNYLTAAGIRLQTWLAVTIGAGLMGFAFHAAILLGFVAARRRLLEEPHRHRRLLSWCAGVGILIGWMGGLPTALGHLGIVNIPDEALVEMGILFMLQMFTGLFGGLGYAALFGLLACWLSERAQQRTAITIVSAGITAVGQRSLSAYLGHSVLFSPVLAAWGLGLGALMGSATMLLFAFGVWLLVGIGCLWQERRGLRGPAEVALRKLAYGSKRAGNQFESGTAT